MAATVNILLFIRHPPRFALRDKTVQEPFKALQNPEGNQCRAWCKDTVK
jgi:hypothetical protein